MNKVKTRKEMASEFGVTTKTLARWLKKNNIMIPRGLISSASQKKIYSRLGDDPN